MPRFPSQPKRGVLRSFEEAIVVWGWGGGDSKTQKVGGMEIRHQKKHTHKVFSPKKSCFFLAPRTCTHKTSLFFFVVSGKSSSVQPKKKRSLNFQRCFCGKKYVLLQHHLSLSSLSKELSSHLWKKVEEEEEEKTSNNDLCLFSFSSCKKRGERKLSEGEEEKQEPNEDITSCSYMSGNKMSQVKSC